MVPVFMRHYCITIAIQAAQVNNTAIVEEMQAPLLHRNSGDCGTFGVGGASYGTGGAGACIFRKLWYNIVKRDELKGGIICDRWRSR